MRALLLFAVLFTVPLSAGERGGPPYRGNTDSRIFHHSGCSHFACRACRAEFLSRAAAIAAGYRPCKKCSP